MVTCLARARGGQASRPMADDTELYADIDDATPRLPSSVELGSELVAVRSERQTLEAQLEEARSQNATSRDAIQDLTRRSCVMLKTARLELQRKDEQLQQCRRDIARVQKQQRAAENRRSPRPNSASPAARPSSASPAARPSSSTSPAARPSSASPAATSTARRGEEEDSDDETLPGRTAKRSRFVSERR